MTIWKTTRSHGCSEQPLSGRMYVAPQSATCCIESFHRQYCKSPATVVFGEIWQLIADGETVAASSERLQVRGDIVLFIGHPASTSQCQQPTQPRILQILASWLHRNGLPKTANANQSCTSNKFRWKLQVRTSSCRGESLFNRDKSD
jgi:hypothetical protein